MTPSDLEDIEQQLKELELIKRAGEAAEQLIRIVQVTPYEELDGAIAGLLGCTALEARTIRHLSLDRLSPFKLARISSELDNLRQRYAGPQ